VDDSPLDGELIRRTLAPLYIVEVFTDGAAVIEHFACGQTPDAVILDWRMPGITGIDVCQFLRARPQTQSIPILMLTVQRDTQDLVRCLAAGADDFLSKPYQPAELSARLAALVRSKRMHQRLETAERAVRSLLMQLPDAVMSIDATGCVAFVNLEAERMLGCEAADLVGRPLREVLPTFRFDPTLHHRSAPAMLPDLTLGHRVFAPAIRPYAGTDANETTLSFREVTTERQHELERSRLFAAERAARTQAELASRAKDEFLAIVSHELRTPLNAILGWARMLRRGAVEPAKRDHALETIERNAKSQQKLIEDILDVSRITSGKLHIRSSPVALSATVQAAYDAVRLAADAKSIQLIIEPSEDVPSVVGDPERLQQIVWNLLSNAVKFTPRGGSVFVHVSTEGDSALIRIRDTGEGITKDFLPYTFDRFRQAETGTTRSHGGLGLGLSIVRHLTELHGGSVSAHSDGPGTGSTFTVRLPLTHEAMARTEEGDPTHLLPSAQPVRDLRESLDGVRVLVVDDDADSRELVVEMLKERAAEASAVGSTAHALKAVQDFQPHVVVSDIGMPTDDGYALVERLRALSTAEGGTIPTVALTAFAGAHDRRRALAAGFDAYIAKPVDAAELVTVVAKLAADSARMA
jgi:signal transduction histidine kinase/DNA-binding response OmpR family regulator